MIELSIIVPVYNEAPYLRRCLDSILRQKTDEVEVIVIDDASTDGSDKIMMEYAKDFQIAGFDKNVGVSKARNSGIYRATGNYVTFIDSDDEYLDGAIDAMVAIAKKNISNIVQFNHLRYYAKINKISAKRLNAKGWYTLKDDPNTWYGVWNKIFKREFLVSSGIRFKEGMQYGEDELFSMMALQENGRMYHAPQSTVLKHFENKDSLSHIKGKKALQAQIEALEEYRDSLVSEVKKEEVQNTIDWHWNSKAFNEFWPERGEYGKS